MLSVFLVAFALVLIFAPDVIIKLGNNLWTRYLLLPLLISLVGAWIWLSEIFLGFENWLGNKKKNLREYQSGKELSHRIIKLRKTGK